MISFRRTIYTIIMLICALSLKGDNLHVFKNINYFSKIINTSNSKILENGLKVEYSTNNIGENECRDIYKKIIMDKTSQVKIAKSNQEFYIDFINGNRSGYIGSIKQGDKNRIVINIIEENNINDLERLKEEVEEAVNSDKQMFYYQYLKAKLNNDNLNNLNIKLMNKLKSNGATNVESLSINNGFYTVANTNIYNAKIDNGKLIDINYALCNYTSGNYIIIGTPEITTSF